MCHSPCLCDCSLGKEHLGATMRDNAVNSGKAMSLGMKDVARCACVFLQILFFTAGHFIQQGHLANKI
eukprot:6489408-Amphidinium_carterae.3